MRILLSIFFLLIYWSAFSQISGLNVKKNISQYVSRHWDSESDLKSEVVLDIVQTKDKYIWMATYEGLVRFDGYTFTHFSKDKYSELPASYIMSLAVSPTDEIWVGTSRGLVEYSKNKFVVHDSLKILDGKSIGNLFIDSQSRLWIASSSKGFYCYEKGILIDYTKKLNLTSSVVHSVFEDNEKNIWLGTNNSRLIKIAQNKSQEYTCPSSLNGITSIKSFEDKLILGTNSGVYSYEIQTGKTINLGLTIATQDFIIDQNEYLWAATLKGIERINLQNWKLKRTPLESGLHNIIIQCLLFDDEGNLWAGTYRDGLHQFVGGAYTTYSTSDGLSSNVVGGIAELDSITYVLGTEDSRLFYLKENKISPFDIQMDIPKSRLKHLTVDSKKRIWIATYSGLVLVSNKHYKVFNRSNGFPDNLMRVVYEDSKGNVWVGTKTAGLICFSENEKWEQVNMKNGLCSNYILSITETKDSTLIISTADGVSFLKNKKVVKNLNTDNVLPSSFTYSSYNDGTYTWIASNDGIWRYDGESIKIISKKNGLLHNSVFAFLEDKQGNLWIPSEKSVMKIAKTELNKVADGKTEILKYQNFDKSHGLKSSNCIGASQPYVDSNGLFWISTLGGVAKIDTEKKIDQVSEIFARLERVVSDENEFFSNDSMVIPPGNNRLSFVYTAFNYKQPESIKFKYKLEPYDKDWVEGNALRTAVYTNMEPGKYTFLLKAEHEGNDEADIQSYKIRLRPFFWQTKIFKIGLLICFFIASYIFFRLRTRNIRIQNNKLEGLVQLRTNEINEQNQELKSINDQLGQKNIDLKNYNTQINQQKLLIEKSNEHIQHSIKYAFSIQNAMLNGQKMFPEELESFVIYKPKDIVSGDFYWASPKIEHRKGIISKYIAVVDCTGHGVPGAFMSMIGSQTLNSIVANQRTESPKTILEELDKEVKHALNQNETSNKDGMDLCLCLLEYDIANKSINVRFSGAKRDLYHYISSTGELNKLASTRRSIGGGTHRNKPLAFTEVSFPMASQDILYLSTDGIIHQPNKDRKPFGSKRLEDILIEHGKAPLTDQKNTILSALDAFQNETEQRDDITLLAIKRR